MILNFQRFVENQQTGLFQVEIEGNSMNFTLDIQENPTQVLIILGNEVYDELSVNIPASEDLQTGEFFLNPKIHPQIVKTLVNQGFIEETSQTAVAGDQETRSYMII
jgi:hypothetical protein